MKTTKLICQLPGCGREYDSHRSDSKYCSKRHRTAAWRLAIHAKENPSSIRIFGKGDSVAIRSIKKSLCECLIMLQEFQRIKNIPVVMVKELYVKLNSTIDKCIDRDDRGGAIYDHVVWIWEKILPFLEKKIKLEEKSGEQICKFIMPSEILVGIDKLISE